MSRHVSYRGTTIDMDSIRRENEKTTAMGNMNVNAKGDQVKGGKVTRTADEIARDNHRVKSAIIKTGLKGPMPKSPEALLELPKPAVKEKKAVRVKEIELDSGDIIIEEDTDKS